MIVYKALHRFADVAPRKMRPIASLIRGMNVDEAVESLKFLHNRGARLIEAVVKSALGNAEDLGCRSLEDLVVSECRIDGAPMFKRIRPRARGTAFGIKRRLAHIIVTLAEAPDDIALPAADGFDSAAPDMVTPPAPAAGMPDAPQLAAAPDSTPAAAPATT
jgi:large subunit ribosomal protein L22